jgi:hypothetical protein
MGIRTAENRWAAAFDAVLELDEEESGEVIDEEVLRRGVGEGAGIENNRREFLRFGTASTNAPGPQNLSGDG